jgi:hypothetical protein
VLQLKRVLTKREETLSYCLHQSVLADVQKVYQPLGESIANRKIKKGKGVVSSGTARAKKSREIVLRDPDPERDGESVVVQVGSNHGC